MLEDRAEDEASSISPDGRYLVYQRSGADAKTKLEIWMLPLFGEHKPSPIVQSPFTNYLASISPDGKWLAYTSDETGGFEVYITRFPEGGPKWQVSNESGISPRWRADGKELFFLSEDYRMMSVEVSTSARSVTLGAPHVLFQTSPTTLSLGPFDVSANGKKFLVNFAGVEQDALEPLTLVTDWMADLKK